MRDVRARLREVHDAGAVRAQEAARAFEREQLLDELWNCGVSAAELRELAAECIALADEAERHARGRAAR